MGTNLQVLGLQAIPRLAKKTGAKVDFPEDVLCKSLRAEDFQKYMQACASILDTLFRDYGLSWRDVYEHSDIGKERLEIAREMQLEKDDVVLDVGCGRGYFSAAAARSVRLIVGVDLMNGLGRRDWWSNFAASMVDLHLCEKVSGVKANAKLLPFKSGSFDARAHV